MENITVVIKDAKGQVLYTETSAPRTFKSGKTGFGAYGKVPVGTDRFQLSFNLVKIVKA